MSGLFTRLVARTLRVGPMLSPILPTGMESWTGQADPAADILEGMAADAGEAGQPLVGPQLQSALSPEDAPHAGAEHEERPAQDRRSSVRTQRAEALPSAKARSRIESVQVDEPATPGLRRAAATALLTPAAMARPPKTPPMAKVRQVPPPLTDEPVAARQERRPARASPQQIAHYEPPAPDSKRAPQRQTARAHSVGQLTAPAVPPAAILSSAVSRSDVQVTIGRVEVRAAVAPQSPPKSRPQPARQAPISLADYLAQRKAGRS